MLKSKKLFGIPLVGAIIAIIAILVVGLGGGYAFSSFLYSQQNGGYVKILSDNLQAYTTVDAMEPFSENITMDFGQIFPGQTSEQVTLFLRNESGGASKIKPQIMTEGLPQGVTVSEKTYGEISASEWRNLYQSETFTWTSTGLTCHVGYYDMTAEQDSFLVDINTIPSNGIIKIDSEVLSYSSIQIQGAPDGRWHINGLQRGLYGTKPAAHAHLAVVEWGNASYVPLDALEVGEVQPVILSVVADDSAPTGDLSFNVLLQATSQH